MVVDLGAAQKLAQISQRVSGVRLRLKSDDLAKPTSEAIRNNLGYRTRYWFDMNRNLFEAAELEKAVIFFVLLVMVIAASFNISSTLFVSVMRRYGDISILKTMGANRWFIIKLFTSQGLLIGFLGAVLGLILGLGACFGFMWAQKEFGLIPSDIYKLDHVDIEVRFLDLLAIFCASLLICFVATLAPSRRGARMVPVEGLHYE